MLADSGLYCDAHPEQCSLVEFVAFAVRGVIAHVVLSAAARITKKTQRADQHEGDASSDSVGELE